MARLPDEYPRDMQGRLPIAGPGIYWTQNQVASLLGITRNRVQQIEANALRKIKKALLEEDKNGNQATRD